MVLLPVGNDVFAHARHASLPGRHAAQFTFRVNVLHRINPLSAIAYMRFIASAP